MPYIAIKGYPKDEETVRKVAEQINQTLLELWGCPQAAINISYEAIPPEQWDAQVERGEILEKMDRMLIHSGKRLYGAKKLTVFHLTGCPYCANARRAVEELRAENPDYAAVNMEWIEEEEQPEVAERYDYYRVPTIFAGEEKLYEASPGEGYEEIKAAMKRAFDAALS